MKNAGTLQVTTPTDREIAMTRVFDAPRQLVFDAWTQARAAQALAAGLGGWTMRSARSI